MRGEIDERRARLEHDICRGLGIFLHQCEGVPPALNSVAVTYEDSHSHDVIHCIFVPDQHFRIAIRGERLNRSGAVLARELTRQLYSRLFEDHMVNLEVRGLRQRYEEAVRTAVDPSELHQLRGFIEERERHIREHHRGDVQAFVRHGHRTVDYRQMYVEPVPDRTPDAPQIDALALRLWSRQLERNVREGVFSGFLFGDFDVGGKEAQEKGLALLKENLTPVQLQQYEKRKHFEVVGCDTRKLYRIRHGRQMNIEELDTRHRRVCGWCFLPSGALVVGDVLLAQKIALETNETAALKIANRFG